MDESCRSFEACASVTRRSDGDDLGVMSLMPLDIMGDSYGESDFDTPVGIGSDAAEGGVSGDSDEEQDSTEGDLGRDDLGAVEDMCLARRVGRGTIGSARYMEISAGSGAAEVVAPPSLASDYRLRASTGS